MVEKRGCGGGSNDNDCGGCMGRLAAIVIVECILLGWCGSKERLRVPSGLRPQGTSTSTKPRNPTVNTLNHPDSPPSLPNYAYVPLTTALFP